MRPANLFRLGVPLAGLVLLLSSLTALSDSDSGHSKFAGVYLSTLEKKGPSLNVSLGEDGSATVTEDTGQETIVLFGHWVDSGDQVTVKFDATDGKPAEPPMVFQSDKDGLRAVTWNHADWGDVTPPPMKKGYKVKDKYWTTTVR